VTYFGNARRRLSTRRSQLERRIASIEDDLDRYGSGERSIADSRDPAGTLLHDFMQTLRRELGPVDSALRRIDSREYDCCIQCGGTIQSERLERLPYAVNCDKCSRHFPLEYIQQLRAQHSSLRRTIFSVLPLLEYTVDRCEDGKATPANLAPTFALLADVSRQLPERFQIEEEGGYLAEALSAAPRYSKRATELMHQHGDFSLRIRAIVKDAESATDSVDAWRLVHQRFRRLSMDLLAHEQAETDILESAFLDDLGGID
jgi:RNA polymerase-binding transcription factor DksA